MAEFRIAVVVDPARATTGIRQVDRQLNNVGQTADRVRNLIARTFAFIGVGAGIRQLVNLADTYTNIQNRLRTVTTGTEELGAVTEELFQISNRTRSSFAATAEVYARVGLAARDLGVSQDRLLTFTESLNQAVILSGASAQEAQAGLIQLSQGLASGALRGDELRSVLEQLPVVADVIAESLGVTRGQLRELGAEGAISAETVLNAFQQAREELAGRFAETVPTISQSFQILQNQFVGIIGAFNESTGAAAGLSQAIIFLADNLETILRAAAAVATVFAVDFARRGVGAAINAVRTLTVVIAANPLGALAVAITTAIAFLVAFSDQITLSSDGIVTLGDVGAAIFEELQAGIAFITSFLSEGFGTAVEFVTEALGSIGITFNDVLAFARTFVNSYLGFHVGLGQAIGVIFNEIANLITENFSGVIDTVRNVIQSVTRFATQAFQVIAGIATEVLRVVGVVGTQVAEALGDSFEGADFDVPDRVVDFGTRVRDAFLDGFNRDIIGEVAAFVDPAFERIATRSRELAEERIAQDEEAASRRAAAAEALATARGTSAAAGGADSGGFQAILDNLQQEADLLRVVGAEREVLSGIYSAEQSLKRQLTETESQLLEQQIRANTALQEERDLLDEIQGPRQEYETGLATLNRLFEQGLISTEQFNDALVSLRENLLADETDLSSGFERGLLRIREQFTDTASLVEDAMVNAFQGAEDALVSFVQTGKLDFSALADSIIADLTRIAVRQAIVAPLAGALGLSGEGGGLFGELFGFQNGGAFTVGGTGGSDSQVVAFRATPGERVDVSTPMQQQSRGNGGGGGDTIQVNFNVSTPDAESFRRSRSQLVSQLAVEISRAKQRNT